MDLTEMNAFLKSVCEGQVHERFIDGYSIEIEKFFVACGYVAIEGDGVYKRIIVSDKGRECYRHGGFRQQEKPNPIGFN